MIETGSVEQRAGQNMQIRIHAANDVNSQI